MRTSLLGMAMNRFNLMYILKAFCFVLFLRMATGVYSLLGATQVQGIRKDQWCERRGGSLQLLLVSIAAAACLFYWWMGGWSSDLASLKPCASCGYCWLRTASWWCPGQNGWLATEMLQFQEQGHG